MSLILVKLPSLKPRLHATLSSMEGRRLRLLSLTQRLRRSGATRQSLITGGLATPQIGFIEPKVEGRFDIEPVLRVASRPAS